LYDSRTSYAEKKSGGMYIIQQRNYLRLSFIIYIQKGQVTKKVSLFLMIIPSTLICNSLLGFNVQ